MAAKALSIIKLLEIIDRKKFAKVALDEHIEAFVMHVTILLMMIIHLVKKA